MKSIIRWALGKKDAVLKRLSKSVTRLLMSPTIKVDGDTTDNGGGAPAGGVIWEVDPQSHDGVTFIAADTFLAEYEPQVGQTGTGGKVWMLDDKDTRHDGASPLREGFNVFLFKSLSSKCKGQVIRTAEYGTDGLSKNFFIPLIEPQLEAHHLPNNPNVNSTKVRDEDGREGTIDDQWRVRRYNSQVRAPMKAPAPGGNTSAKPVVTPMPPVEPDSYGVYLNCGQSGVGNMRGHGMVHFDDKEGRLAMSMDGPLRSCAPKHEHNFTGEAPSGPVEISITSALYGDGSDPHSGTLDWTPGPAPKRRPPTGIEVEVYFQPDPDKRHTTLTGEHPVKHVWWTKVPVVELPPCKDVKQGQPATVYQDEVLPSSVYVTGPVSTAGADFQAPPNGWWSKSA